MNTDDVEEKVSQGYLQCNIIIEILGTPQTHVEGTLKLVLSKLAEEKDVFVISSKVHPSKPKDKLFSTFSEVEILFKDLVVLTRITFDYMPSSIEILKPEQFKIPAVELSNFVSDMLASLHQIDYRLKDVRAANSLLEKNSANLLKNFLLLALSGGSKTTEQISKIIGINSDQLEKFIEAYAQENLIRKKGKEWEKV